MIGGAFYPAISSDGKVAFSLYEEGKYKLAIIDDFNIQNKNIMKMLMKIGKVF